MEDKEKGIKIAKADWEKLHVQIVSYNNFPTAAGLASAAAGLACLGNLTIPSTFSYSYESMHVASSIFIFYQLMR